MPEDGPKAEAVVLAVWVGMRGLALCRLHAAKPAQAGS